MKTMMQLSKEAPRIKQQYPPGTRVLLNHMEDQYAPVPDDTKGTVKFVDDIGQIFVDWDNGRSLPLNPDEDSFRKLTDEEMTQEVEKTSEQRETVKPDCPLIGADGNIYNLIGIATKTLKRNGMREQADEMFDRIQKTQSYYEALNIIGDYVNIISVDDEMTEEAEGVMMQQ